jgi:hypothetical protein
MLYFLYTIKKEVFMKNLKRNLEGKEKTRILSLKRSIRDFSYDIEDVKKMIDRSIRDKDNSKKMDMFELGILTLSLKNQIKDLEDKFKMIIKA